MPAILWLCQVTQYKPCLCVPSPYQWNSTKCIRWIASNCCHGQRCLLGIPAKSMLNTCGDHLTEMWHLPMWMNGKQPNVGVLEICTGCDRVRWKVAVKPMRNGCMSVPMSEGIGRVARLFNDCCHFAKGWMCGGDIRTCSEYWLFGTGIVEWCSLLIRNKLGC